MRRVVMLVIAAAVCAAHIPPGTVILQDFRAQGGRQNNMTEQQQTFVLALQGLANRDAPRLFLNVTDENMSFNSSGMAWAQWISEHKGLEFVPQYDGGMAAVCRLASQLADPETGIAKGLVLWDDMHATGCYSAMRTLAITIAGLQSLLPVTPTMLQLGTCLQRHTVTRNLTAELELAGVFADDDCDAAANEWGMKHLLPKTNRTAVFAIANNAGNFWLAADYAVSQSMYSFSLEPNSSVNSRQAALFRDILVSRDTPAAVFGWPSVHEGAGTTFTSKAGCYVMCAAAEDLSFFASVQANPAKLRLPTTSSSPVLNRSRSYITFQTNEGDTPKSAVGLQHGSWLDPGRGSAKVSWGFNPRLCHLFPIVCEYYAATATPKDSFFSHSSGYMNVWEAEEESFKRFAEQTATLIDAYMPESHAVDVWTGSEYNGTAQHTIPVPVSLANYTRYQRDAGGTVKMFTQAPAGFDNMSAVNLWLSDGTPVFMTPRYLHYVCEIPYYACDSQPERSIAQRIIRATTRNGSSVLAPPRFAMVYGLVSGLKSMSIFDVIQKVDALLPEDIEIVSTDDFVSLARAAAPSPSHT